MRKIIQDLKKKIQQFVKSYMDPTIRINGEIQCLPYAGFKFFNAI